MKQSELRQLDKTALERLISEQREKLREALFKAGQGELKDVREIRTIKKLIARIKTLQNQKIP
ncbi:MAG: 50S ribosomal protein L29 [Candidatus Jacksonbacteria bacterium]|nr:50S ribosomal protein L29 [Candidatus Jacksonbacteria bacterium]